MRTRDRWRVPASSGSEAVGSTSARSVACMWLMSSAAGMPLPDTSATHSSTRETSAASGTTSAS